MLTFCDDDGNHPASLKTLKMEIFPADDFGVGEIKALVTELGKNGLIVQYEADNKQYWHVTGWKKHQKIEKPTYKHPKFDDYSESARQPFDDYSESARHGSGVESSGVERIGEEETTTSPLNTKLTEQRAKMMINEFALCFSDSFGIPFPRGCNNTAHQLCSEFNTDRIKAAFEIAAKQGIMTVAYVEGVLRGSGNKRRSAGNGMSDTEWILSQNAQACRDFVGAET
jgi:hypothetical protein